MQGVACTGVKIMHSFRGETWWKGSTWKTRHRREDRAKMDLKEMGWEGMEWITVAGASGRLRCTRY